MSRKIPIEKASSDNWRDTVEVDTIDDLLNLVDEFEHDIIITDLFNLEDETYVRGLMIYDTYVE